MNGTSKRARVIAAAVLAAGLLHAAAGRALAAVDPIAALHGPDAARAIVAVVALCGARLFLYLVAPGWAAWFVAHCVGRAIAGARTRP
jgi:hypothetical protein